MTWTAAGSWLVAENSSSLALTNQAAGNLLLVEVHNYSNNTVFPSSMSGGGATWTLVGAKFASSTGFVAYHALFAGLITATGSQTATVSWSGTAPGSISIDGHEFHSTVGSWALDVQGNRDTATTASWASLTPAAAAELYFGSEIDGGTAVGGSTSGYIYNVNSVGCGAAYNLSCPQGIATFPVWGDTSSRAGIMVLMQETPATGGGLLVQPGSPVWRRRFVPVQQLPPPWTPTSATVIPATATAAGAAYQPGWGPVPALAVAAGACFSPAEQVTALDQTGALATATAYNGQLIQAALAAGTAYRPGWGPGTITAAAPGTAAGPAAQVTALPSAAVAAGTAVLAAWGPGAATAAGTGTAYSVALIKIVALPPQGAGTGAAYGPVERSPALEVYGFGTFPQVPVGAIILSVVANVVWTGSNASIQAPFYELWDGTSARIGAPVTGTASVAAGHRDSVVFTGVVYSQLATLRLRIYATSLLVNAGATASFDAASLSVAWSPNTNAATAPAALAVVPVLPAAAVSNGITAAAGLAGATGAAYSPLATGAVNAAAAPGVLAVVPVLPQAAVGVGTTATAGMLAVVPVIPAIPDVTGPGWAASDDQPAAGTGSWVNPGNITGSPDGSNAVWTAV